MMATLYTLLIVPQRAVPQISRRTLRSCISSWNANRIWKRRLWNCSVQREQHAQSVADTSEPRHERLSRTYQHEADLPRLPLPSLQDTAEKYLRSVRPLVDNEQFQHTTKVVTDFISPNGLGPVLQKRLEVRRQDPKVLNWLAEWWNETAYMGARDAVIPSTSYFFSFVDDPRRTDPIKRAAAICTAILDFKKFVDDETLTPDYVRDVPQAMDGYRYLFNSCRIPDKPIDYTATYDPRRFKHILVVRKNMFFKMPHEHDGIQLTSAELEEQFAQVYELATDHDDHGVGILTSENRNTWAEARKRLIKASPANESSLFDIQSASFVVCLDDAAPESLNQRARQYFLSNNSSNRWYDKPVNFIMCDSGAMGYYGEHSHIDGGPVLRLTDTVVKRTLLEDSPLGGDAPRSNIPGPEHIRFELNEETRSDIEMAKDRFEAVKSKQTLHAEPYSAYGKNVIKSLKCSPDAYVQLVIQLAYRLFTGTTRPTYESATTRSFRDARTEACRIVSEETVAFCDAMQDSDSSAERRRSLFKKAMERVVRIQKDAGQGLGVDRHLFGLQLVMREGEERPEIFTDPAYEYSRTWTVTSSQVSSEFFATWGYAQVVPDGIGIAYSIKETNLLFTIASESQDCKRIGVCLSEAADSIRSLMSGEASKSKAADQGRTLP